jgi:hypothetical protein
MGVWLRALPVLVVARFLVWIPSSFWLQVLLCQRIQQVEGHAIRACPPHVASHYATILHHDHRTTADFLRFSNAHPSSSKMFPLPSRSFCTSGQRRRGYLSEAVRFSPPQHSNSTSRSQALSSQLHTLVKQVHRSSFLHHGTRVSRLRYWWCNDD